VVRTGNFVLQLPWAVASLAWVLAQLGEASEALNRFQEASSSLSVSERRGLTYHALGRASLLIGGLDQARRLVDRAIAPNSGCGSG
jgi:hypothetical protein